MPEENVVTVQDAHPAGSLFPTTLYAVPNSLIPALRHSVHRVSRYESRVGSQHLEGVFQIDQGSGIGGVLRVGGRVSGVVDQIGQAQVELFAHSQLER